MQDEVTALVLTFNEAPNIERTLRQLTWVKQILIVDSFSSDGTVDLAKAVIQDAVILQRKFDTHTDQWNFGLSRVTTPWVLSLDADYVLTPELISEIAELNPAADVEGYRATFRYCIQGRPLRASVYPPRVVLFRRDRAVYREDGHTQLLQLDGTVASLRGRIDHDDRKPFSDWLQAQGRYSKIEAKHLLSQSLENLNAPDRLRRKIFFAAPAMFLYLLFGRGLILDGWPGWFYVCQRTIAELLLSIRLIMEREKLG